MRWEASIEQQDGKPAIGEQPGIRLNDDAPPVPVPPGHVGPVVLPGTGRLVWWTGRVAIGLRHEPPQHYGMHTQSSLWVQELLLAA